MTFIRLSLCRAAVFVDPMRWLTSRVLRVCVSSLQCRRRKGVHHESTKFLSAGEDDGNEGCGLWFNGRSGGVARLAGRPTQRTAVVTKGFVYNGESSVVPWCVARSSGCMLPQQGAICSAEVPIP